MEKRDFPKPVDVTLNVPISYRPKSEQEEREETEVPEATQPNLPVGDEPLDWMEGILGTEPIGPLSAVQPEPIEDYPSEPPTSDPNEVVETTSLDNSPPEWIIFPEMP